MDTNNHKGHRKRMREDFEKGILEKIAEYQNDEIIYTLDTHFDDYLTTAEGKSLPVPHCM